MEVVGVIPARYKSSRFPGKPLVELLGKPMIIHVAEKVAAALGKSATYIATDDLRIKRIVEEGGYKAVMTSEHCLTGTDRLWDFAQQIKADIYVNIQGDEPLIAPEDILRIVEEKKHNFDYVINGMAELSENEDPSNINIPKVLTNRHDNLLYMSRLPIPGIKDLQIGKPIYWKQVCIYAFSYSDLKLFGECAEKAAYEKYEDIEILRFFDLGIPVKMVKTRVASLAVDTPEDVLNVENALRAQ